MKKRRLCAYFFAGERSARKRCTFLHAHTKMHCNSSARECTHATTQGTNITGARPADWCIFYSLLASFNADVWVYVSSLFSYRKKFKAEGPLLWTFHLKKTANKSSLLFPSYRKVQEKSQNTVLIHAWY